MAHHVQRGTACEAEASAKEVGRLVYSKSSFDRLAHAVGELYADHNVDVEDALITVYEPPEDARSRSVGLDRVSMPVLEPDKDREERIHTCLADGLGRDGHDARPRRKRATHDSLRRDAR